ncbi:hypothetical protein LguiA_001887 [Lonicera macranthoides]
MCLYMNLMRGLQSNKCCSDLGSVLSVVNINTVNKLEGPVPHLKDHSKMKMKSQRYYLFIDLDMGFLVIIMAGESAICWTIVGELNEKKGS